MKRLNPITNKPFKNGDTRQEDSRIFNGYKTTKIKKDGFFVENWITLESLEKRKQTQSRCAKANYEENKIKYKDKAKIWAQKNPDKSLASKAKWREANRDQHNATNRDWNARNQHVKTSLEAKRRAAKLQRTPKWLTAAQLKQIADTYAISDALTKITGIPHEVDHVVPLQGKKVSGLHVPWNLHVKTAEANRKKSNKHEV